MICSTCRDAADARAPRDQHCNTQPGAGAACDCAHRTDRYGTASTKEEGGNASSPQ